MTIFLGILLAICELVFAAIILTEIYWAMRFIADRIIKVAFDKIHDAVLRAYVQALNEQLLRKEANGRNQQEEVPRPREAGDGGVHDVED